MHRIAPKQSDNTKIQSNLKEARAKQRNDFESSKSTEKKKKAATERNDEAF